MTTKLSYYTEEGLQKLKEELREMESVERPRISQQIAEARDKGDLSENAEYDAAKEAQGLLEMRISKLKEIIANARIIDESSLDHSKAIIISPATLKNLNARAESTSAPVAGSSASLKLNEISVGCPSAAGLIVAAVAH